jgi:hippurate hydrolase
VPSIAAAFGATRDAQVRARLSGDDQHGGRGAFAADVAGEVVGRENVVHDLDPSMGSEDFSFMLQRRPGAYARLGRAGSAARRRASCTTAATTSTTA